MKIRIKKTESVSGESEEPTSRERSLILHVLLHVFHRFGRPDGCNMRATPHVDPIIRSAISARAASVLHVCGADVDLLPGVDTVFDLRIVHIRQDGLRHVHFTEYRYVRRAHSVFPRDFLGHASDR